jgi:hypothetical protein
MISKKYLDDFFIKPLEEKHGALATTIPEQRTEYMQHYYALLKYHPRAKDIIAWMLRQDAIIPPRDLAIIISDESNPKGAIYDTGE